MEVFSEFGRFWSIFLKNRLFWPFVCQFLAKVFTPQTKGDKNGQKTDINGQKTDKNRDKKKNPFFKFLEMKKTRKNGI